MSILLSVLKIIGIIFGILLAVILGLLLLVLFLPLCYGVRGECEEKNEIQGKLTWLFSLIQVRFEAKGKDIRVWLSLFGWKKYLYPAPEKKPKKEKKKKKKAEEEISIQAAEITPALEEGKTEPWGDSADGEETAVRQEDYLSAREEAEEQQDTETEGKGRKKEKSLQKYLPWNIIKSWIGKIRKFIFSLKKNFANIKRELSDETNKNAVTHILKELKTLLRHIGPRRGKARLRYSTGDPASTGQLTGVFSICPLFYKKGVEVTPDFTADKLYIRGSFRINGHIQMFHLLGIAFRLYRDKNIKKLIQKFK